MSPVVLGNTMLSFETAQRVSDALTDGLPLRHADLSTRHVFAHLFRKL